MQRGTHSTGIAWGTSSRLAIIAATALVCCVLMPATAGALFTYPDAADTYLDPPQLFSVYETGTADYVVSAFDIAADGTMWAAHRDRFQAYESGLALYTNGSSEPSTFHALPGRSLSAMAFGPDGLLYTTDITSTSDTQTVVVFDPDTMEVVDAFGEPDGETYYVDSPSDILVDGSGNVFVLNQALNTVVRFDASTREPTVFDQPVGLELSGPRGMCFGSAGTIVVADSLNNRLVTYSATGSVLGQLDLSETAVSVPVDVYVDGYETRYVLGDSTVAVGAKFIRLDTTSTVVGTYPELRDPVLGEIEWPTKLLINTWGDLWVNTSPLSGAAGVQKWTFVEGNPDLTSPVTTDTAPTSWEQGPVEVSLIATDTGKSGLAGTWYSLDGSTPSILTTGPITITAEGTTTITYRSIDNAGNTESTKSCDVRIDNFAPITGSDAHEFNYGDVNITLTPLDGLSGVTETRWSLDAGSHWSTGTAIYIPGTSFGGRELWWYSVDRAGNIEMIHTQFIRIDTRYEETDPRLIWRGTWTPVFDEIFTGGRCMSTSGTSSALYAVFFGQQVDIYGLYGPDQGLARYSVEGGLPAEINAYSPTPYRDKLTSIMGLNPNVSHVLTVVPLDNHAVSIDTLDIAGTLTSDTTPPDTTSNVGSGWYNPTTPITLTGTDNTYVSDTRYSVNNGSFVDYTGPFTVSHNGTATLEFYSVDGAGNTETTKSASVRCDAIPPVSSSDATSSYIDSATINFSATDNLSGVSKTQHRVDTGSWIDGTSVHVTGYQQHTVDFRSLDVAGNTEATKTVSVLVRRASILYDINSPELTWSGSWTAFQTGAKRTTGSSGYVSGYGRTTRIKLYAYKASTMGYTRITLDGVSIYVNQYSSTTTGPVLLWDSGSIADVSHAFKVAYTGINGGGTNTRINFHSVDVEGVFGGEVPDHDPPATTSNIPAGWVKPPFNVTLTQVDYLGNEGETFYGVSVEDTETYEATNFYTQPFTVTSDGTNTVSYFSQDLYGNAETIVSEKLKLDSVPPTTTSNAVTDYSNSGVITLNPVDTMSGVASTHYRLDGGTWTTGTVASFSKSQQALGSHTLEWYSADNLGNTETTRSVQFTLLERFEDEYQQHIEQEGEDWGRLVNQLYSGSLMRFAWGPGALVGTFVGDRFDLISATRFDFGIARIVLDDTDISFCDMYSDGEGFQQKVFSRTGLGPGEHVFRVEWTGLKNPLSEGTNINLDALELVGPIIGDDEPPVSWTTVTDEWGTTPQTVEMYATDNGVVAPRIYYQLSLNGGSFGPTTSYDEPFEIGDEGDTTISYWAVDGVGNVEGANEAHVRIDRTAPVVTHDAPVPWSKAALAVHLDATDAGVGMSSLLYSTDGSAPASVYPTATGIPVSAEGTTTIRYVGTDLLGNSTGVLSTIARIDLTAPSTTDNAPAGWTKGPRAVTLTPTDAHSGVASVRYVLDGGVEATYSSPVSVSGDGTHTLAYSALDVAGNREATNTVTVRVDDSAPVVTDDAPTAWVAEPVTVHLTATDVLSGVASIHASVNGSAAALYSGGIDVSAEGTTTIAYYATDNLGNDSGVSTATVRIDTTSPVVTDDAPTQWVKGPVSVHLSATDTHSGVASVLYSTDGSTPSETYGGSIVVSAEGTTTIRYKAIDVVGRETAIGSVAVRVDDTAPASTDDAPDGWVASPVDVALSSTDALSGVAGIIYTLDDGGPATYTAPIHLTAEGTHTIDYAAVDAAGNVEVTQTAIVRIDDTAPESTDDAPDGWVGGPVLVHLTAADPVSGVNALLYSTNGLDPYLPYTEPILVLAQGVTTIRYAAIDTKGNIEPTRVTTVSIDDDAPVTTDDAPTLWVQGPVDVTLTGVDTVSGVDSTTYRVNGGTVQGYSTPIHVTAEGTTTIAYASTDVKGNAETTTTATVKIDDTAPVTTSNAVSSYLGTATITLSPVDPFSGVASTQYRLNGGQWTSGTSLTVTNAGTYLLEWRSADAIGNTESVKDATFLLAKRFEQTEPTVYFKGTWGVTSNAGLSGGSFKSSATSGSGAYVIFNGTQLDWITSRNTSYGTARVTLDAGSSVDVDLYGSFSFKQKVWSTGVLPDGVHRLKIEYTGSKNASSTSYAIGVDAFDVVGTLLADTVAPTSSDDVSSAWRSTATTVTLSAADADTWATTRYCVNGGAMTTYTAPFSVSAEGTSTIEYASIDGPGNTEPTRTATVRIDATSPVASAQAPGGWVGSPASITLSATDSASGVASILYCTDGSLPTTPYQNPLSISTPGTTTVRFRAVDSLGNSSSVQTVDVRIDDDAPILEAIAPIGWVPSPSNVTIQAGDALSGVSGVFYSTDGANPTVPYQGSISLAGEGAHTVRFYGVDVKGNASVVGSVTVLMDDTAPVTTTNAAASYTATATISLTATDSLSGVMKTEYRVDGAQWTTGTVATIAGGGTHTLAYRSVDAVGNTEATNSVDVRITVREEQTSPLIAFTGAWFVTNHASLSGGSFKQVSAAGAASTVVFHGTRLDWITSKASSYGKARVVVDGGSPIEVDLYSPAGLFKQTVYSTGDLSDTDHTVRIEYTGSHNASSTGYTIGFDALDITGRLLQADRTAPTSVISAATNWQSKPVTVALTATDDLSTVQAIYYRLDGASTTTYTAPFAVSGSAAHVVAYWAVDTAGNAETARTRAVNVDLDSPVTASNAVTSYNETATIDLTSNDALSGISATQYRIDGSAWTSGSVIATTLGGPHTLDFRAVDVAGNIEATKTALFSITTHVEQTDPLMAWTGAWANTLHANLSGGSFRSASTSGAAAELAFTGTGIDWITSRNTNYGQAKVILDGSDVGMVDLYGTFSFKQKVWSSGTLSNGTHTLKIQLLGSKCTSSTGYSVGLDAFDIVGHTVSQRYEQTSALLSSEGVWSTGNSGSLSGGTHAVSSTNNSAVNIAFNGSSIDWIGSKSTGYGIARVTLDNTGTTEVDLYGSTSFQQKLWSSGILANGSHTLRIEYTGSKNTSSSGFTIGVDAFDVGGVLTQAVPPIAPGTRYEQNSSLLAYDGTWSASSNSGLSGGSCGSANSDGSAVTVAFTGSRLDWISTKASNYGIAKVTLDGGAAVYVDLHGTFAFKQKVWSSGALTEGPHSVRIEWTGTKNGASTGTYIGVDAFDVLGTLTQATSGPAMTRFEQDSVLLAYDETWGSSTNSGLSGGSSTLSNLSGSAVTVAVTGTRIDWIASKSTNYGIAKVTVDGGTPVYVDLYGPFALKQRVWSSGTIANSTHVVKIEWTGTKNENSSGTYVSVDAFDTTGTLTQATSGPATVRFEQTDPLISYEGTWTTTPNGGLSGGSFTSTNSTAAVTTAFSGTKIDWITSTSTNYGIAKVNLDGGTPEYVDLFGPFAFKREIWSSGPLANGAHTLRIEWTGTRNELSAGNNIGLDALDVEGLLVTP